MTQYKQDGAKPLNVVKGTEPSTRIDEMSVLKRYKIVCNLVSLRPTKLSLKGAGVSGLTAMFSEYYLGVISLS